MDSQCLNESRRLLSGPKLSSPVLSVKFSGILPSKYLTGFCQHSDSPDKHSGVRTHDYSLSLNLISFLIS